MQLSFKWHKNSDFLFYLMHSCKFLYLWKYTQFNKRNFKMFIYFLTYFLFFWWFYIILASVIVEIYLLAGSSLFACSVFLLCKLWKFCFVSVFTLVLLHGKCCSFAGSICFLSWLSALRPSISFREFEDSELYLCFLLYFSFFPWNLNCTCISILE